MNPSRKLYRIDNTGQWKTYVAHEGLKLAAICAKWISLFNIRDMIIKK